jgi:hypothetical protein
MDCNKSDAGQFWGIESPTEGRSDPVLPEQRKWRISLDFQGRIEVLPLIRC